MDVRLKIPSPIPFCTFYRWENRASLMSHPIGPKCACRYFFLAFFVLTLCTILFMSKMKGGGLWVFTWENAHQREFHAGVSYWFIIAFIRLQVFSSSHVHVTTLSWFESVHYPLQASRRPIWYGNERSFFVYWYRLQDLAPGWNSTYGTATEMNSRRYDSFW